MITGILKLKTILPNDSSQCFKKEESFEYSEDKKRTFENGVLR